MRHLVVIALLMLASCAAVPQDAAVVQAAQVRAALENRHSWIPATHDDEYLTTSLDELWQAGTDSWYPTKGELGDCDDRCQALLAALRLQAYKNGDSHEPAAFMMPCIMRDGRRHGVIVALCETPSGAVWRYWCPLENRELGRNEILKPL